MTDLEEPIYPERANEDTAIRGDGALQQAADVSAIAAPVLSQVTEHLFNGLPQER